MATFRETPARVRPKPADVVMVLPEHFADAWPSKSAEPVRVGLRLVSEKDLQTARAQASKTAWDHFPDEDLDEDERIDCYNAALMTWVVACATCHPDDASKPWIDMAHDNLQLALTSGGLRSLWERVEALTVECSPLAPEATDDELTALFAAVQSGAAWTSADVPAVRRARRLLKRTMTLLAI